MGVYTVVAVVASCLMSSCSGFQVATPLLGARSGSSSRSMSKGAALHMSAGKALIVQNKGGGHGEIGFHLANILVGKDIEVVLLQDGAGKNKAKEPFASYGDLEGKGVKVVWGDFGEGVGKLIPEGQSFDYVFDNYAKDVSTAQDVVDAAKKWGVSNYVYVSSGGMYKDSDEVPLTEESAVKETGQRTVEMLAEKEGLPWTSFRPQYIYGPKTNKRAYLDYFVDRLQYDVYPYNIPLHGDQLVSITHAEDVASMLASVIGNDKAPGQVFNCGTDRYISYNGLVKQVAKVMGKEVPEMNYYDPDDFTLPKGWFPFRNNHFFVNPEKAKRLLGWKPKHSLVNDLSWYYDGYKAEGLHERGDEMDFDKDDELNLVSFEYVPWMIKRGILKQFPDALEQMEEWKETLDPEEPDFFSGFLDSARQKYEAEEKERKEREGIVDEMEAAPLLDPNEDLGELQL